MEKSNGNGQVKDEGLLALKAAFDGAQFLNAEAKEVSERILLGQHRQQQIPDNLVMEIYATITEGVNMALEFTSDDGNGYIAYVESYNDMLKLLDGGLDVVEVTPDAQL